MSQANEGPKRLRRLVKVSTTSTLMTGAPCYPETRSLYLIPGSNPKKSRRSHDNFNGQDGYDSHDGFDGQYGHDSLDGFDDHDGHDDQDGHDGHDSHDGHDNHSSPDGYSEWNFLMQRNFRRRHWWTMIKPLWQGLDGQEYLSFSQVQIALLSHDPRRVSRLH